MSSPNQEAKGLMTMTARADTSATTACSWLDARVMNLYGATTAPAGTMTILSKENTNKG